MRCKNYDKTFSTSFQVVISAPRRGLVCTARSANSPLPKRGLGFGSFDPWFRFVASIRSDSWFRFVVSICGFDSYGFDSWFRFVGDSVVSTRGLCLVVVELQALPCPHGAHLPLVGARLHGALGELALPKRGGLRFLRFVGFDTWSLSRGCRATSPPLPARGPSAPGGGSPARRARRTARSAYGALGVLARKGWASMPRMRGFRRCDSLSRPAAS